MTDLDQELKQSLASQASRVPHSRDLTRDAIGRAHSIRRRRRAVGGAALAVALAIAVPVGLQVGDAVSRTEGQFTPATTDPSPSRGPTSDPSASTPEGEITGPTRVTVNLADLPVASDPPLIPYVDGRTIVSSDWSIEVPGQRQITAVAPFLTGAHVLLSQDGTTELVSYLEDGLEEVVGVAAGAPLATADLRWNAYAVGDADEFGNLRPGVTLTVLDSEEFTFASIELPEASNVDLHALVDGTVYFSSATSDGSRSVMQAWTPGQDAPTGVSDALAAAYAISPEGHLAANFTEVTDFGSCSAVVDVESGGPLWQTCDHQILGFSPRGAHAWAGPAYADGYAPVEIAILDARTGDVIRKLRGPDDLDRPVFFMDATFEDEDHLLIRTEQDGQTALVRCAVPTGNCELATPLVDGTSESGSPYLLTEF